MEDASKKPSGYPFLLLDAGDEGLDRFAHAIEGWDRDRRERALMRLEPDLRKKVHGEVMRKKAVRLSRYDEPGVRERVLKLLADQGHEREAEEIGVELEKIDAAAKAEADARARAAASTAATAAATATATAKERGG